MNLTQYHIDKIDPLLQDELMRAEGDEVLRVIMALGSENGVQQANFRNQALDRSDFSSTQAYRQALLEQRQSQLARELGSTTKALENLSLEIHGGVTSPIVVVEGTARQILSSLELPGVRSASLEQTIRIIETTPIEIAQNLANIAIEIIKKSRGKFQGVFGKRIDQRIEQSIVRFAQQYIQEYKDKYGILQILGMREPVSLETVYTEVKLAYNEGIRSSISFEELKKAFYNTTEHGFWSNHIRKQRGIEVANEIQHLTVLGAPGSGKSVFLRKIGLEALNGKQGKFKYSCIPVLLELRIFEQSPIDFQSIIAEKFQNCGFPNAEEFTQKALEQGKLLILLDGVDEVPSQKLNQVTETIQTFVDQYKQNHYIISFRTAARRNLRGFTNVEIALFDTEQIQQFIGNWFHSTEDQHCGTARKFWKLLQSPEQATARELAQTPLLLTFICLVYDRKQGLARNRSTLYDKALHILLDEWAAEKRIRRNEIFNKLKTDLEVGLLSKIAFQAFKVNRLFFYKSELIDQIEAFLSEGLNTPQGLNSEAVLNAIAVQQGILVERTEDVYSFSHLTLQEYLTAYYVNSQRNEQLIVDEHFWDRRWREVFLLVAGLIYDADGLLYQMNQMIGKVTSEPKLNALLEWAVQRTANSAGGTKPMVKRANVLLFALNYARIQASDRVIDQRLNRALFFARSFAYTDDLPRDLTLAQELTRALDLAVARTRTEYARDRTLAQELTRTIDRALELARDLYKDLDHARRLRIAQAQRPAHKRNLDQRPYQAEMFAGPNLSTLTVRLEELQSNFPDTEQDPKVYQKFATSFEQICLEFFKLAQTLLNLSQSEARVIEKYFYANDLMVQCSKAPVGGSHKIWQEIEAQMLLPGTRTDGRMQ